jgi:DNA polymerase-3 subunit epsilon
MEIDIFKRDLVFIDLETTGFQNTNDKIIEIGLLKVRNNEIVETMNTLINPEVPLSPDVSRITGITEADLIGAPTFRDVKDDLFKILSGSVFFAHNAHFDYSFVETTMHSHKIPFSAPQICTVKLSQYLYPTHQRHNLDAIASRFNISVERRHRAYDDAFVIWEFFKIITKSFDPYTLNLAFAAIEKPAKTVSFASDTSNQMSLF